MIAFNQLLTILAQTILVLATWVLFIPITVLFIECTTALFANQEQVKTESRSQKVAVLVPAHNEAIVLEKTLKTILPELLEQDRLIVIADNCSDQTAEVARRLGVEVLERQDEERRGKGYALDYGLQFLKADPPNIVVLVDADCLVKSGTIDQIVASAIAHNRPVQATYLMAQPPDPKPKDSVSAFAFKVKNLVRPLGLKQLGLPCLLTGTGMAFPWSVIQEVSLASGNIVEDMQLGIDLAIAGYSPLFCPEARVTGILPQQQQTATEQRKRWEHGHLQTLLSQVPILLKASIQQRRFDLCAIALDLSIPPLSLLVVIALVTLIGTVTAGLLLDFWIPAIVMNLTVFLLFISILSVWAKFGRADLPALTLLTIPFYILWKIPLYFTFIIRPQSQWIRTKRD